MSKTFKEWSKLNWSTVGDNQPSNEQIRLGLLQRIAEANEVTAENSKLMAQNFVRLQSDLKFYKDGYNRLGTENAKLERKNAALRGVITKLKNKEKLD